MEVAPAETFLNQCLLLDIETNENNKIYAVGALYQGHRLHYGPDKPVTGEQLVEIDRLARDARFILGHNIITHDIPRLKEAHPGLRFVKNPAVDTLYLSPLAFPENPYHRLVKDYKIVRDSVNNPAEDAALAGRVFSEQWEAFAGQLEQESDIPLLYRSFLDTDKTLVGTAQALEAIGVPVLSGDNLYDAFARYASKHACVAAVQNLVDQLVRGELEHPQFAYICAWLSVAGGNSLLPPWVRHCGSNACRRCSTSCAKWAALVLLACIAVNIMILTITSNDITGLRSLERPRQLRTTKVFRKRSSNPQPPMQRFLQPCLLAAASPYVICCLP